jgi:hypothetical protein
MKIKEPQLRIRAAVMPQMARLSCMFNVASVAKDFGWAKLISSQKKA